MLFRFLRKAQIVDHCWHNLNQDGQATWFMSGAGVVRCCQCAAGATRGWEDEEGAHG